MDLEIFLVHEDTSVAEAMRQIDKNGRCIVFVCNSAEEVVASLTDGDIRRHILSSGALSSPVSEAAKYSFTYQINGSLVSGTQKQRLGFVPVLDEHHKLISLLDNGQVIRARKPVDVPVVIMAGGKGTRLYPYTQVLPKPLIPVGEMTITEHIISRFREYSCLDITMIVNHKREMIKAYFADVDTGATMRFIDEQKPLGTGGGLGLLRGQIDQSFFMTNCDVLIDADYADIYEYHRKKKNLVTIVCAAKTVVVPYGTVTVDEGGAIASMREKPEFSFLTNTGFYVMEPEFLEKISPDTFIHVTDLIQNCMDEGLRVGVYPISEAQWSDMGQLGELEKMRAKLGC